MSPAEVVWRVEANVQDVTDRFLRGTRERRAARLVSGRGSAALQGGFVVPAGAPGAAFSDKNNGEAAGWVQRLRERGERCAAGRLTLFDVEDCVLGEPIDWNRDPKHGVSAPRRFAPSIDYRDFEVTGDCKFVWEPNRHQHLVVLGRAYRVTGNEAYARAVTAQLSEWLDQCPYGIGMNWRSPLELAIRLINWVWALDLVRPAGVIDAPLYERLLASVYLHLEQITRKYSRGSSANNHRIGEAAGVYIASRYFRELQRTTGWSEESHEILCEEILEQTYPDGGSCEHALGYHLFVLQFFTLVGLVGRWTEQEFPPTFWTRLRQMFEFVGALCEGGEPLPMFGDCDDGYVLDVDADPRDPRPWLAAGAVLFNDAALKAQAGSYAEACHWLFGPASRSAYDALEAAPADRPLRSRAFTDSGCYLLQSGACDAAERISVMFDCGRLGFRSIAAHGHADALSFTLRAFGVDVLVDPGTYDYFTYPAWREYFRSTRAHNTVVVDGLDQSEMLGAFLWGRRADARCLEWTPTANGGRVRGQHDGYRRLANPLVHRRRLELDGGARLLRVEDELISDGAHNSALYFHLAETCRIAERNGTTFEIETGRGRVTLVLDPRLTIEVLRGSEVPIGGWVSRGYHRKVASDTIIGRWAHEGTATLETRIQIGAPSE